MGYIYPFNIGFMVHSCGRDPFIDGSKIIFFYSIFHLLKAVSKSNDVLTWDKSRISGAG